MDGLAVPLTVWIEAEYVIERFWVELKCSLQGRRVMQPQICSVPKQDSRRGHGKSNRLLLQEKRWMVVALHPWPEKMEAGHR